MTRSSLLSLGRMRPNRTDGVPAWQASFSPDGERLSIPVRIPIQPSRH